MRKVRAYMDIVSVIRLFVVLLLIALLVIFITKRLAIPYTLGLVVVGLVLSLLGWVPEIHLTPDLVLFVFLPSLLFEGSWLLSWKILRRNWMTIFLLAVPGLLLGLGLIAVPLHIFTTLSWIDAFLLAAILSPTDPVAVLGLFRQLKVDRDLSMVIEGESLFNDGVAGVLYQVFLAVGLASFQGHTLTGGQLALQSLRILLLQAGGGVLVGGVCGYLISRFVKYVNDHLIETTITIVTAYGVYLLADQLHMSGILAVIVAALILGNYGREHGMTEHTSQAVEDFWGMIAFVANALLFLLVGAQLNPRILWSVNNPLPLLLVASLSIVSVLVARLIIVALLPQTLPPFLGLRLRSWRFVIFWSGLRGALSLALVLALPLKFPDRPSLLIATYAVVLFTLLVQGLSVRYILHRLPTVHDKSSL